MHKYCRYTEQEDKVIIAMHGKGFDPKAISKVLLSRNAENVKDRGYALGLHWSKKPEIDMKEFNRLMKGE